MSVVVLLVLRVLVALLVLVLVGLFLVLVGNPKEKCVCGCLSCAGCPFSCSGW